MPKLYYVDDQLDYKETLSLIIEHAIAQPIRASMLNQYTDVDRFMRDIEAAIRDPLDGFLLDINMPVPRRLKTKMNIWPTGHAGESQFCGIALAKWLLQRNHAHDPSQIAFLTHWDALEDRHEAATMELSIVNIEYRKKSELITLRRWITQRFL